MADRLDEIDRRIIYRLAENARDTSAPMIADGLNVSAGTIRNRIRQLEDQGIVTGYHAAIDYERADGSLTTLFVCNAPVPDRERLAKQVLGIPGVVNVRELMTGRGNLHVKAVGEDTDDLSRVANVLSEFGVEIENEDLIQHEQFHPYQPYGPEEGPSEPTMTDFMSLAAGAEVVDLTVDENAPITEQTLQAGNESGLLDEDVLVVAIERGETILTPKGGTIVHPDDLVTVFSPSGVSDDLLAPFSGPAAEE